MGEKKLKKMEGGVENEGKTKQGFGMMERGGEVTISSQKHRIRKPRSYSPFKNWEISQVLYR
jgi:hypothetical protein